MLDTPGSCKHVVFSPSSDFWMQCAEHILSAGAILKGTLSPLYENKNQEQNQLDLSGLRIIVPTFNHVALLTQSFLQSFNRTFIPPHITTLPIWLATFIFNTQKKSAPHLMGVRVLDLYSQLRQHAWLKSLFSLQHNTELLPLAKTLVQLCDELTEYWLPDILQENNLSDSDWPHVLHPLFDNTVLSQEAQLVWQIWKSQLSEDDPIAYRYSDMQYVAQVANEPLFWVTPTALTKQEQVFLAMYAEKNSVQVLTLDWSEKVLGGIGKAWPQIVQTNVLALNNAVKCDTTLEEKSHQKGTDCIWSHIKLCPANTLEKEAQYAAQTIVNWLVSGKSHIALVAQDRVVARRIRSLLERAGVYISDETGWKLSTTRAAATVIGWFELVYTQADSMACLDFLKSSFVHPIPTETVHEKSAWVLLLERAFLENNILGGWDNLCALAEKIFINQPSCYALLLKIREYAHNCTGEKNVRNWAILTHHILYELGVSTSFEKDPAGKQINALLEKLSLPSLNEYETFSFYEWRTFLQLTLEESIFHVDSQDKRVVMLPLNGMRLRYFDAVWMAGCDAAHLPSATEESLFFSDHIKKECGLVTRLERQQQQLRDLAEMMLGHTEVVFSWQARRHGENNALSPWIQCLHVSLLKQCLPPLETLSVALSEHRISPIAITQPAPAAPYLRPLFLSPSAYNKLLACPYQFFALYMLDLSFLEPLSDRPEKRDYGSWVHDILNLYHNSLSSQPKRLSPIEQEALLRDISTTCFAPILEKNPQALGYWVQWEKVIPAYVAWSDSQHELGWSYQQGEITFISPLTWEGGSITIKGKMDRLDKDKNGLYRIIDYKTQNILILKKKIKEKEDIQLPFYGLLAKGKYDISHAHYVSLQVTEQKVSDVAISDYTHWQTLLQESIIQHMDRIDKGARLPAHGTNQVCAYCKVRGLCRKGVW